jgi:hypothetical protein
MNVVLDCSTWSCKLTFCIFTLSSGESYTSLVVITDYRFLSICRNTEVEAVTLVSGHLSPAGVLLQDTSLDTILILPGHSSCALICLDTNVQTWTNFSLDSLQIGHAYERRLQNSACLDITSRH